MRLASSLWLRCSAAVLAVACSQPGGEQGSARPASSAPQSAPQPTQVLVPSASVQASTPRSDPSVSADAVAAPLPASQRTRYRVAAMGDSLTDPRSHGGKYLDVLRARCPKSTFVSFGKGGNMVSMMLKRFQGELYGLDKPGDPPRYTHILLLGGLGDVLSNEGGFRTPQKVAADIGKMVEIGHAHGAKVLLLTLPPWGGMKAYDPARAKFTAEVNAWLKDEMALGHFDGLFDTRPLLACGDPEKLCEKYAWPDRIHWSKAGHDVIGDALQRAMFADCE